MRWVFSDTSGAQRAIRTYASFSQAGRGSGRSRIYAAFTFSSTMKPDLRAACRGSIHLRPSLASAFGLDGRTDWRLEQPIAFRLMMAGLAARQAGNQAAGRAASEHSVVTKYSATAPIRSPVITRQRRQTLTIRLCTRGKPFAPEHAPSNVVYCGPAITEYQPVTAVPPPAVTYLLLIRLVVRLKE